jgi:transposase
VFIDEFGNKTNTTRKYGWGLRSRRLIDHVPFSHWITTTAIYALRSDGVFAAHVVDGAMNREKFLHYIREILGPALRPGDAVTCDNLSVHKGKDVESALAEFKATREFLPPYSPDENPIENSISKVKSMIAKREIRVIPELQEFLRNVPELFTPTECGNYFKHAGYGS